MRLSKLYMIFEALVCVINLQLSHFSVFYA
jgi:hypothetical protein